MAHEEKTPAFASMWARKGTVVVVLLVSISAGVAYTVFAPPVWEARATVIFPVRQASPLGLATADASSLASALGGPTPVRVYAGILESSRTVDFVAKGTGLSRLDIRRMSKVLDQAMENTITVSASSQDPLLAQKVVDMHIKAMEAINQDLNMPQTENDVEVLRERISSQNEKIATLESLLLEFQSTAVTAPTVTPTGTGKESTIVASPSSWVSTLRQLELQHARIDSEIAQIQKWSARLAEDGGELPTPFSGAERWRQTLSELEYELRVKELTYAPTAPEVKKLREQIAITRGKLEEELAKHIKATQEGFIDPSSVGGDKLPGLMAERVALEAQIAAVQRLAELAPGESVELSRLLREIATHTTILNQLEGQLQLATIQQVRDPNRWEVLDSPYVEDRPLNKSFLRNGLMSLFIGFVLAFFVCALPRKKKPFLRELDEAA